MEDIAGDQLIQYLKKQKLESNQALPHRDRRYARAAAEASARHGVPVLTATELVYADREYGNAGPLAVKEAGRVCYPSAHRAVGALQVLVSYADYRRTA